MFTKLFPADESLSGSFLLKDTNTRKYNEPTISVAISGVTAQTQQPENKDNSIKTMLCRLLTKFERHAPIISKLYLLVLFNGIIVCILLVISRIFNNQLWHSSIFRSDSAPLLLLALVSLIISYTMTDYIILRLCLSIGCALMSAWSITNVPLLFDSFMFNGVMCLLNVKHATTALYEQRHIAFEGSFEQIYVNVFKAYLNRVNYQKLITESYERRIKKGEIFLSTGDEITSLSCLVSGRISAVRQVEKESVIKSPINNNDDLTQLLRDPNFVNLCQPNEFVEAPQWIIANLKPEKKEKSTLSFIAIDDCQYIKWPKEGLIKLMDNNKDIYNALQAVLGLDTAHALLKSREYRKIQTASRQMTEEK
eukprot:57198_1